MATQTETTTNPVGWFEIPVKDMTRAKAFYESVFETKLEIHDMGPLHMAWFPMHMGMAGAAGTLVKADSYIPSASGTIVYFSTSSIENALKRAQSNGGKVCMPKTSIGEHGFIAHLEDSEGNRIALHSLS